MFNVNTPLIMCYIDHELIGIEFLATVLNSIKNQLHLNDAIYLKKIKSHLKVYSLSDQKYWQRRCQIEFPECYVRPISSLWCLNFYSAYVTYYKSLNQTQRYLFNLVKSAKVDRTHPALKSLPQKDYLTKLTSIEAHVCEEIEQLAISQGDLLGRDSLYQSAHDVAISLGLNKIADAILKKYENYDYYQNHKTFKQIEKLKYTEFFIDHEMMGIKFLIDTLSSLNNSPDEQLEYIEFIKKLDTSTFNNNYWYNRCAIDFPEVKFYRNTSEKIFWLFQYFLAYVEHYQNLNLNERHLFSLVKWAKLNEKDGAFNDMSIEVFSIVQARYEAYILNILKNLSLNYQHVTLTTHFNISLEDTAIQLGLIGIRDYLFEQKCSRDPELIEKIKNLLLEIKREEENKQQLEIESNQARQAGLNLFEACLAGNIVKATKLINSQKIQFLPRGKEKIFPIHQAILLRRTAIAKQIIEKYPEVAIQTDKYGQTPLMYAAKDGNHQLVRILLTLSNVNASSFGHEDLQQNNKTALHLAIENDFVIVTKHLQKAGAVIDSNYLLKDRKGIPVTDLHLAIHYNSHKVIKYLLKVYIPPHTVLLDLIQFAFNCNNIFALKLLLIYSNFGKVFNKSQFESRAFESAVKLKLFTIAEHLIHNDTGLEVAYLRYAIKENRLELLRYLLDKLNDAYIFKPRRNEQSLLSLACEIKQASAVMMLLEKEMQVYEKDVKTNTLLFFAIERNYLTAILLFPEDYFTQVNEEGLTPLMYAAKQGNLLAVKNIIARGTDINYRCLYSINGSKQAISALGFAIFSGQLEVFNHLLSLNTDTTGCLLIAVKAQQDKIVELLLANNVSLLNEKYENASILEVAIQTGNLNIVRNILKYNKDFVINREVIQTIFEKIKEESGKNHKLIEKMLIKHLSLDEPNDDLSEPIADDNPSDISQQYESAPAQVQTSRSKKKKKKKQGPVFDGSAKTLCPLDFVFEEYKQIDIKKCQIYYTLYTNYMHATASTDKVACMSSLKQRIRENKELLNAKVFQGFTPLMLAVKNGNLELVRYLLEFPELELNLTYNENNQILSENEYQGWTALHFAVENCCKEDDNSHNVKSIFMALINNINTNYNKRTAKSGSTAMHLLLEANKIELFYELYKKNINQIFLMDNHGATAFTKLLTMQIPKTDEAFYDKFTYVEIIRKQIELWRFELLINHRYCANLPEKGLVYGCNVLHEIVATNQTNAIACVMRSEVDYRAVNQAGDTPLTIAVKNGDLISIALLLRFGDYKDTDLGYNEIGKLLENTKRVCHMDILVQEVNAVKFITLCIKHNPALMAQIVDEKEGHSLVSLAYKLKREEIMKNLMIRFIQIYQQANNGNQSYSKILSTFNQRDLKILKTEAVIFAITSGMTPLCESLLQNDPSLINQKNSIGITPKSFAKSKNKEAFLTQIINQLNKSSQQKRIGYSS